ncbi:MAG: DUF1361 domain-containing protein [Candidatus Saccharimonadales bacterium]
MSSKTKYSGLIRALIVSNIISIVLFCLRVLAAHNTRYWFLIWNLVLAWLPVVWAYILTKRLKTHSFREPVQIFLFLLWLGFLPNSFYVISDLVHLTSTGEVGLLFDAVLFMSFIWNALVAGFISMYWIHKAVLRRRSSLFSAIFMQIVIVVASFAIYLGRTLRWNTWDVAVNPFGILFDVSERVINPLAHPQVIVTTATFSLLIGSIYFVIWELLQTSSVKPTK